MVEDRKDELIDLISRLIRIGNENPTGTQREVVGFVGEYLGETDIAYGETGEDPDYPCVATRMGSDDGYSLIFNGHVSAVPTGDRGLWDFDPFCGTVTDSQILGRGTSDMKAGVAGVLFIMALLRESNVCLKGNIRLHIVSDEESDGEYGSVWLCKYGYARGANGYLMAEPTSMVTIEVGQKRGTLLTIRAHGEATYGSLENYKGENAILKIAKVFPLVEKLIRVGRHFSDRQLKPLTGSEMIAEDKNEIPGLGSVIDHITTNIGLIQGGARHNMVPDCCETVINCRLPIGVSQGGIAACIEEIRRGSEVDGVDFKLNYRSKSSFTDHGDPLVLAVKKNMEALLGTQVVPTYQWAPSDTRDYRRQGIPTVQFGPFNTVRIHSYNETVEIEDVVAATRAYVITVCDLVGVE